MKKLVIKNIKEELQELGASKSVTEILMNNVQLYNDLIDDYHTDNKSKHSAYLMYQLNGMIMKQLQELRKLNQKQQGDNIDDDDFNAVVKAIKNNKAKPVAGFVAKKDDEPK